VQDKYTIFLRKLACSQAWSTTGTYYLETRGANLFSVTRIYKQVLTISDKMFMLEMAYKNLRISPNRFIYRNKKIYTFPNIWLIRTQNPSKNPKLFCKSGNRPLKHKQQILVVQWKKLLYVIQNSNVRHQTSAGRTRNSPKLRGPWRRHRCHDCSELTVITSTKEDLVKAEGQPGLQPHGEAQETTANTSAAPPELKRVRQWTAAWHEASHKPTTVNQAFKHDMQL
jgi:hypothetical protein